VFIKVKTPDAAIRDANASANPSVVAGGWGRRSWRARSGCTCWERRMIDNEVSVNSSASSLSPASRSTLMPSPTRLPPPPFSSYQHHLTAFEVWAIYRQSLG
jgi:hypothetical protein